MLLQNNNNNNNNISENISENTKIRWTKEVNKIVMRYFYQSDLTKQGYRKQMMKIWREIGVFEVTEQRLADQKRSEQMADEHV